MKKFYARHGDVDFFKTKLPKKAKLKHAVKQETVALGEKTGHHHTLFGSNLDAIKVWEYEDKKYYEICQSLMLKHQEHEMLKIDKGVYEIQIEQEYDPFTEEIRKVVD